VENPLWRNSKWVSKFIAMAIACLAAVWVVELHWQDHSGRRSASVPFRWGSQ